jgi:hypothetical protein
VTKFNIECKEILVDDVKKRESGDQNKAETARVLWNNFFCPSPDG